MSGADYWGAMDQLIRAMCPDVDQTKAAYPVIMAILPWSQDIRERTNRQVHEEAAGMNLDDAFFTFNKIDPDAVHVEEMPEKYKDPVWSEAQGHRREFIKCIRISKEFTVGSEAWLRHRTEAHTHRQRIQALGHDIVAPLDWELDENWPILKPVKAV